MSKKSKTIDRLWALDEGGVINGFSLGAVFSEKDTAGYVVVWTHKLEEFRLTWAEAAAFCSGAETAAKTLT